MVWLTVLSLVLACAALNVRTAHAGYWMFQYESSGVDEALGFYGPWSYSAPWSSNGNSGGASGGNVISTSGTVKPIAVWVPSGPSDLPPTKVVAKIYAMAYFMGDCLTPSVNNGFGDPVNPSGIAEGIHLVQKKNDARNTSVEFPSYTLTASATAEGPSPEAGVGVYLQATPDNRSVTLTRQGARGETVDADGNIHGHTTYSYRETFYFGGGTPPPGDPVVNWQHFTAALNGSWSTISTPPFGTTWNVTRTWDPEGPDAGFLTNKGWVAFGNQNKVNYKWVGESSRDSDHVAMTYTAKDNSDGAEYDAKYYLTFHDHYERKTYERIDTYENWRPCSEALVGPADGSIGGEISYTVSLSASAGGAVGEWIAKLLGVNLEVQFSGTFNSVHNLNVNNLPAGQYVYMEVGDHYIYHRGTVDEWDEGGYVALQSYNVREVPEHPRVGFRLSEPRPIDY